MVDGGCKAVARWKFWNLKKAHHGAGRSGAKSILACLFFSQIVRNMPQYKVTLRMYCEAAKVMGLLQTSRSV